MFVFFKASFNTFLITPSRKGMCKLQCGFHYFSIWNTFIYMWLQSTSSFCWNNTVFHKIWVSVICIYAPVIFWAISGKAGHFILVNFVQLASVVLVVFGISFGPYIYHVSMYVCVATVGSTKRFEIVFKFDSVWFRRCSISYQKPSTWLTRAKILIASSVA